MKEFASEELASFNGKDGKPVYVAFQGRVYDVTRSRLWSTGSHMKRHPSGKDLAGEISAAPHGPEVLERYPQIGILRGGAPEELKHLPSWLQNLLERFPFTKRHPHPMVVHFPIAFLMAASLFILLHLFFRNPSLELTGFYLLILGTIATPFALATGFLTWWINYMLKPNPLIKKKIHLSFLLIAVEIFLVLWRGFCPAIPCQQAHPLYVVLMLILTPMVGLIGYYGGQMTFPAEK
jgi:predicted heme/steroid binding protein/uncharacterized membrane protein